MRPSTGHWPRAAFTISKGRQLARHRLHDTARRPHQNAAKSSSEHGKDSTTQEIPRDPPHSPPISSDKPERSVAELDAELQEKLADRSGEGGAAAVEYEDGKPASIKRSVKNNMFRYI